MKHLLSLLEILVVRDFQWLESIDKKKVNELETSIVELYSLIHQRFVVSEDGLEAIVWNENKNWMDRKRSMIVMSMDSVLDTIVMHFLFFLFLYLIWIHS